MILQFKYLLVGAFNVIFTLTCLIAISSASTSLWSFQVSFLISSVLGVLVGYQTTKRLVWKSDKSSAKTFLEFISLSALVSLTNWFALMEIVRIFKFPIFPTQLALSIVLSAGSFIVLKYKIFGVKKSALLQRGEKN